MGNVRFALSPTSHLTAGNARLALVNWLHARKLGGTFHLRFEDADRLACRPEYIRTTREDLAWLGLLWDSEMTQSSRLDRYRQVADKLRGLGRLYPCWETPQELEERRRRQVFRGQPAVYDRASLVLPEDVKRQLFDRRKAHWRFFLGSSETAWDDLVRGNCAYDPAGISDPVLITEDGIFQPMLRNAIDDIDFGVTDVIREEDQVVETVPQMQIAQALSAGQPRFGHLPLLSDTAGQSAHKQFSTMTIAEMREDGIEPMAVLSLLAAAGTGDSVHPRYTHDELVAELDLSHYGRASAKLDPGEMHHVNRRLLQTFPFASARGRLEAMGIAADEKFWMAARANLGRFSDVREWWRICGERVTPKIEDTYFLRRALELLPPEPWDGETCRGWARALQAGTGRQGRNLFHPLRLALTGRAEGPDLQVLLPLIGRNRTVARLRGETC